MLSPSILQPELGEGGAQLPGEGGGRQGAEWSGGRGLVLLLICRQEVEKQGQKVREGSVKYLSNNGRTVSSLYTGATGLAAGAKIVRELVKFCFGVILGMTIEVSSL